MDTREKILALFDRLTAEQQEAYYQDLLERRGPTPTDGNPQAPPAEPRPHD